MGRKFGPPPLPRQGGFLANSSPSGIGMDLKGCIAFEAMECIL